MELHLAHGQRADVLALLLAVADVHHRRVVGLGMARGVDRRELAELRGKAHLGFLVEILAAQHDDQMLMPRPLDVFETINGLGSINAADLRAQRRRKRNDFHRGILVLSASPARHVM